MGAPFAAVLEVAPASPAGAYPFAPVWGTQDAELHLLVISVDVAQWVTVTFGTTALPLYVGPGGIGIDLHNLPLSALNAAGRAVTVNTSAPCGVGGLLTGCTLP